MLKYRESMKYWNYDDSSMITSVLVWDLKTFRYLIFIEKSVPGYKHYMF